MYKEVSNNTGSKVTSDRLLITADIQAIVLPWTKGLYFATEKSTLKCV